MTDSKPQGSIDFVTYAADNYAHWIEYWLDNVSRSNPGSRLWIYDVTATPTPTLARLAARFPNAQVIPWPPARWESPAWIEDLDFKFFWPGFNLRDEVKYLSRRLRHRLTGRKKHDWMINKKQFTAGKKWFLHLSCIKPHIIRNAMKRGLRPLAFVDADAIVLASFSQLPSGTADAGVAVVDPDQIRIGGPWEPEGPDGPLPVSVINAGVLFFNYSHGAQQLLDSWIREIARIRHGSGDQTALANLLYRHNPHFHETMEAFSIPTGNGTALVAPLPCARYNQVRIARDGKGICNDTAIAHFVGSWKQPDHWHLVGETIRQAWAQRGLDVESSV